MPEAPCADLPIGECYPETRTKECCNVCWGYSTFFNYPGVTWVGMMLEANHDVNKCERGCLPCKQEELFNAAVHLHGTRWMRAYEPIIDENNKLIGPLKAHRKANGMVGDLRSLDPSRDRNRALRVPKYISFLRGVCFHNPAAGNERPIDENGDGGGNGEGFGTDPEPWRGPANPSSDNEWDACDCSVEQNLFSEDCGQRWMPAEGVFRDEFFFPSPNYSKPFYCRKLLERKSQIVDIESTSELMPAVILSAEVCGANYLSYCAGKGKNDEAHCYEYGHEYGIPREEPWLDAPHEQQWNRVYLDLSQVKLGYSKYGLSPGPNLLIQDEPTRDFKNRIIQTLSELPNINEEGQVIAGHPFEQMAYHGTKTNGRDIEHWSRVYKPLGKPNFESFAPAFELHKCRLRKTGAPVTVVPFVIEAKAHMNFQLIRVDLTPLGVPYDEGLQRFVPHCRFHLVIQMGYRAIPAWSESEPPKLQNSFLPEDHPKFVAGSTVLEILNFDDPGYPHYPNTWDASGHNLPPIVRRVGDVDDGLRDREPDRILYVDDDDRQFDPPSRIDWWGFIGAHSTRARAGEWHWLGLPLGLPPGVPLSCCYINYKFQNIAVGGWPMIFETIEWEREHRPGKDPWHWDNGQIYGGWVDLNFFTDDDTCPEQPG